MEQSPAFSTYQAFAGVYNDFNHANDYEMWLGRALLPELTKWGLPSSGAALDVGCGTGRAFAPLLRRGWSVHGCDLSPAMLEIAAVAGGREVTLEIADMRRLPSFGSFDLVLCLNDSLNYLLGDEDLLDAFKGMRANLGQDGLLVFDVNSRVVYEEGYSAVRDVDHDGRHWQWTGLGEVAPSVYDARIEGDDIEPLINRERFRSATEIWGAVAAAGLTCLATLGMDETDGEVVFMDPPDESRHYKMVFIAKRTN
ncbi:MAG TPA: class I SAM-dependent methyltransferase [Solirubrobacterales bacterium]|nr:class I SAM-dependent methyltransferase [Solirubrobacterales bacterium]